jgi:hypothetical protein
MGLKTETEPVEPTTPLTVLEKGDTVTPTGMALSSGEWTVVGFRGSNMNPKYEVVLEHPNGDRIPVDNVPSRFEEDVAR